MSAPGFEVGQRFGKLTLTEVLPELCVLSYCCDCDTTTQVRTDFATLVRKLQNHRSNSTEPDCKICTKARQAQRAAASSLTLYVYDWLHIHGHRWVANSTSGSTAFGDGIEAFQLGPRRSSPEARARQWERLKRRFRQGTVPMETRLVGGNGTGATYVAVRLTREARAWLAPRIAELDRRAG